SNIDVDAKSIVQFEGIGTSHNLAARLLGLVSHFFKEFDAAVKSLDEFLLLAAYRICDLLWVLFQLVEKAAHHFNHRLDQLTKKRLARSQMLPPVTLGPAENPLEHVIAAFVPNGCSVGEGKRQSSSMVCNHAVSGIFQIIESASIGRRTCNFLNGNKERGK